jgi:hypothetical protein
MVVPEWVTAALTIIGSSGGAWLAVRVEIRWLRSDVDRHERTLEDRDRRLRALEQHARLRA